MIDANEIPKFDNPTLDQDDATEQSIVDRKSIAGGVIDFADGIVEITKMRGNFWRVHGFSENQKSLLYPEEALYLVERQTLYVEHNGELCLFKELYEKVLTVVPLACYLAYLKLKSLEYITFRHSRKIRSFCGDVDVYNYLLANPSAKLLTSLVSFNIFPNSGTFSKKNQRLMSIPPVGHVIVMTGQSSFSPRIVTKLIEESDGVPIIFAVVTNTGHVLLEEYSDALTSLNWNNPIAMLMDNLLDPMEDHVDDNLDAMDE